MAKQNVSDKIFDILAAEGVRSVFGMTGGAVAFMLDRLAFRDDVEFVCTAHEQAASMMAEVCARVKPGALGVAIGTSGPGAANLLTGIGCAWFDSVPCLFITGQVNTYEAKGERNVRQLGFQEMDIVDMAAPITKFAAQARTPEEVPALIEKAIHIARSGRSGPVLIDLPMNLQRQEVEENDFHKFNPEETDTTPNGCTAEKIGECVALIEKSERPVILVGGGARRANADDELLKFAESMRIPVCASMNGIDVFPHDNPLFAGFIGVYGSRAGNFTIANSDLLIVLGSRLDSRQTGVKIEYFARHAKKIVVDVDPEELGAKIEPDAAVLADVRGFLVALNKACSGITPCGRAEWLDRVRRLYEKYPPESVDEDRSGALTPYGFFKSLSDNLGPEDVVALDTGQNMLWGMQVIRKRGNMRIFTAGGMSPMGYSFPAAIGAAICGIKGRAVAVIGDGGMQINIQELETVKRLNLQIKTFVINNSSLGLIRQFQDDYLGSRHMASADKYGYSAPDFVRIAEAYGINATRISDPDTAARAIREIMDSDRAELCEVVIPDSPKVLPKALIRHPMEDQYPYLPKEELLENVIDPIDPDEYRLEM